MNFRFYLSLIIRRLPVMLIFMIICSAAGIITALNLPPTYKTVARLLVEDAQIDTRSINPEVAGAEQLQVIEQRLITRANMLEIANKFDVIEESGELTPDEIVARMVNQTEIRRTSGRNQATLMSVSFEARTGQIAANVLNEYLTIIQEDSRSSKEEQANRTLAFFEQEVERLSLDLDKQSVKIVEFKTQNPNALPEDAGALRSRQAVLVDRLERLAVDQNALSDQREEIVAVYEATGRISAAEAIQQSPEEIQLIQLKLELEGLRAVYSETYPKVAALKAQVERLEAVVLAQPTSSSEATEETDVQTALLNSSLSEIDDRLEAIEADKEAAETELDEISRLLAAVAGNAIALDALERDHQNIQGRYNAAVNNLDTARLDLRVLRSSQGQRIDVIEGASVPQVPTGPNRTRIAAMGVGAGLGLAAAYFMLLEFLNRTIRRPAEIQSRFNIVPIAVIPYIESRRERLIRRSLLVLTVIAVLIGVPAILWYIDTNVVPLQIIMQKAMDRVGI